MGVTVSNIQRMCFHDGPGIRTTVFLKGCGIRCPWCANPENLTKKKQYYYEESKCRKAGEICIYNKDCIVLGKAEDLNEPDILENKRYCPLQALRPCGEEYEADELVHLLEKDSGFWGIDGGVTFSGGEPLLQASGLLDVWKCLKEKKIHMAVETSLFVPESNLKMAMDYIDFFYVDVKLLDQEMCRQVLGGDVELYLNNVQLLSETDKEIHFRIPCSEEYVLVQKNWETIRRFLKKHIKYPVQIFRVHDLGESKYRNLGMKMEKFRLISDVRMDGLKRELEEIGVKVTIINI